MASQDLKVLIKQRSVVKGQMTRVINSAKALENNIDAMQFARERLEKVFERWNDIQQQIECLDETGEQANEAEEVEKQYQIYHVRLSQNIRNLDVASASASASPSTSAAASEGQTTASAKLFPASPQLANPIKIPEFDGNPDEWYNFRDTFTALVHDNPNIPEVQKFHILRNALKGTVVSAIRTINITAENYQGAWEQLKKKCEVPRRIIQGHLRHLLDLPEVVRDSPAKLSQLLEEAEMRTRALQDLHSPDTLWNSMLVYIIMRKLDKNTRRAWERSLENSEIPAIDDLIKFLERHARGEVEEDVASSARPAVRHDKPKGAKVRAHACVTSQTTQACFICKGKHMVHACATLLTATPRDRFGIAKRSNLCINCLRPGHIVATCTASNCQRCGGKHHTLLHFEERPRAAGGEEVGAPGVRAMLVTTEPEVLLGTAVVAVRRADGQMVNCRILLDSGAQSNLFTEDFANILKLPIVATSVNVSGIGQFGSYTANTIEAQFHSNHSNYSRCAKFRVIPHITGDLPERPINKKSLRLPRMIGLADPAFHQPGPIQGVLGNTLFYQLLSVGQINLPNSEMKLQKTLLGWIVVGEKAEVCSQSANRHCGVTTLDERVQRFWELENPEPLARSYDDHPAEIAFRESHRRDHSGRYIVSLPTNGHIGQLGDSFGIALRRFNALERKFGRNPQLASEYRKFMDEYRELGHMEPVDSPVDGRSGYFLPHHAVFKVVNGAEKIRVVFDASAAPPSGLSLNECLITGPTIQENLFTLLCRFRTHRYALVADIEKMYRQVKIDTKDRHYQCILWRDHPSEDIRVYQLTTVTYGTTSAPFLATRCLVQLARDEGCESGVANRALSRDFYIDDLLSGAATVVELQALRQQLIELAGAGGFNLRQWASNEPSIAEASVGDAPVEVTFDVEVPRKTLGVVWHPKRDTFGYAIAQAPASRALTKRNSLSSLAQIFDPLGLLGPIIVIGKCILQKLWASGVGWDESPPQSLVLEWRTWASQLATLNKISVPRRILVSRPTLVELHGFADASTSAYGACIYIRSRGANGVDVRLLCSKSRVAPLKTVSVPRLELSGAYLLAQLYKDVSSALNLHIDKYYLWSDSTVTLHWLRKSPHELKTFVANRVAKIQEKTDISQWRHVSTRDNPADALSRGQPASVLANNRLWWHAPAWLQGEPETWPSTVIPPLDEELPEERHLLVLNVRTESGGVWSRFSKWVRLMRVLSYCLRWGAKGPRLAGPLTADELSATRSRILKLIQEEAFGADIAAIGKRGAVDGESRLRSLSPFLDNHGILRVGGRLRHAKLTMEQRHPVLLPKNHPVSGLILTHVHATHWHTGVNGTLNALRQRYWLLGGRGAVRGALRRCVVCAKSRPVPYQYEMGALPESRVSPGRPFSAAGIDFCGPFFIKEKRHRNTGKLKTYVAVFVCFATKAVHLELVTDLTAEACLAAIKRFVGRRGIPAHIHTDNGSNFIGSKNELERLINLPETRYFLTDGTSTFGIQWHFSPPRAPHFGGLWEAAVKAFKAHLHRTLKDTLLSFEALNTCLVEIEAILNSRPLTPISSDPEDLTPLTPSHFLIGKRLTNLPQENVDHLPDNRLSAWQQVQKLKSSFWRRWHREYLHELHTRGKWHLPDKRSISEGQLVVIQDDNLAPMHWKMGRITKTFPGTDNIVRVVEVRTVNGTHRRPVKKLCPLPIN